MEIKTVADRCLDWDPAKRPTFSRVVREFAKLQEGPADTLIDKTILRLDKYSQNQEAIVAQRQLMLLLEK